VESMDEMQPAKGYLPGAKKGDLERAAVEISIFKEKGPRSESDERPERQPLGLTGGDESKCYESETGRIGIQATKCLCL
jgi:hypothetical protein